MSDDELREVDAQVHREVFGFSDIRRLPTFVSPDSGERMVDGTGMMQNETFLGSVEWCYLPRYDHDEKGDEFCEVVPDYHDDMGCAWEIVEHLQAQGHAVRLSNKTHVSFWWVYVYANDAAEPFDAVAQDESAPLAICRAALEFVRKRK